jgi:NADH-quinone oxidoreductase subunit F
MIIMNEHTDMVRMLRNCVRFYAHESCGQCTPCREGTGWMHKIVDRMLRGQGRLEDLKILDDVAKSIGIMPGTTICGLADGAGWPIKNAVAKFRPELEAYIRSGQRSQAGLALADAH